MTNEYVKPSTPPPPLFLNQKERNLVKQINDELLEKVIGQVIAYYPLDINRTRFHPLYGEAIHKFYLKPLKVNVLVEFDGGESSTTGEGIENLRTLNVFFHKRRITEDQDLYVSEGDFVLYGTDFYEVTSVTEPTELFGRTEHKMEVKAICKQARKGAFKG